MADSPGDSARGSGRASGRALGASAGEARELPSDPASEPELLAAARDGDREAFGALVASHQRAVYGLALRLCRDPDAARDLAQEAFVRAWAARARFDPERPFAPWVLTITRRLGVDRLRYRGRWKTQALPPPEAPGAALTAPARAETALQETEQIEALARALATLSEHYQSVIELHHLQGRPVAEIARILGRPPGTVMTWLYRARAALKAELESKGITP